MFLCVFCLLLFSGFLSNEIGMVLSDACVPSLEIVI